MHNNSYVAMYISIYLLNVTNAYVDINVCVNMYGHLIKFVTVIIINCAFYLLLKCFSCNSYVIISYNIMHACMHLYFYT